MSISHPRREFMRIGLAGVALFGITACASLEPEGSEKWRAVEQKKIQQRAEARWDALIKRDMKKAYAFTTPAYRNVVTLQQYVAKYGRVLDWRKARVLNVSYDDLTVATVSLEITYRVAFRDTAGAEIETPSVVSEKWIYKDREWWYIAN